MPKINKKGFVLLDVILTLVLLCGFVSALGVTTGTFKGKPTLYKMQDTTNLINKKRSELEDMHYQDVKNEAKTGIGNGYSTKVDVEELSSSFKKITISLYDANDILVNTLSMSKALLYQSTETPIQRTGFRYFVFDIEGRYRENGITIGEIQLLNQNRDRISYLAKEISNNNYSCYNIDRDIPGCHNSDTIWSKVRLNDNNFYYVNNPTGATSNMFMLGDYSQLYHIGVPAFDSMYDSGYFKKGHQLPDDWDRFVLDTNGNLNTNIIKIWLGSPEGRIPKKVSIYGANQYTLTETLNNRSNDGLFLLATIYPDPNLTVPTEFYIHFYNRNGTDFSGGTINQIQPYQLWTYGIMLDQPNIAPSLSLWSYSGGASCNGEIATMSVGGLALSPFIDIGAAPRFWYSMQIYGQMPSPINASFNQDGTKTVGFLGTYYYDSNYNLAYNTGSWQSNGYAKETAPYTWSSNTGLWGWGPEAPVSTYLAGNNIRYMKLSLWTAEGYPTYWAKNPILKTHYYNSGTYISKPIELKKTLFGGLSLSATSELPEGTSVKYEARTSLDGGKTWSEYEVIDAEKNGSINSIPFGTYLSNAFVQYRVTMQTTNKYVSPIVKSVTPILISPRLEI